MNLNTQHTAVNQIEHVFMRVQTHKLENSNDERNKITKIAGSWWSKHSDNDSYFIFLLRFLNFFLLLCWPMLDYFLHKYLLIRSKLRPKLSKFDSFECCKLNGIDLWFDSSSFWSASSSGRFQFSPFFWLSICKIKCLLSPKLLTRSITEMVCLCSANKQAPTFSSSFEWGASPFHRNRNRIFSLTIQVQHR